MPETLTIEPREATVTTAPTDQASGLPPELLQIPSMQGLLAGTPPAVSDSLRTQKPETKLLLANKDKLLGAGFGLYRSLSGDIGVMFNQLYIHGDDILAADKAGQLLAVAPPVDKVNAELAAAGTANPVMGNVSPPTAFAAPRSGAAPPQSATGLVPPAPAPASNKTHAKMKATALGIAPPTTGPAPGAGRILNSILTPAT